MWVKAVSSWGDAEADVVVTDGEHACTAFCYPCTLAEGDRIEAPIDVLDTDGIVLTSGPSSIARVNAQAWPHRITGQLVQVHRSDGHVAVGGLVFEVGLLPGDASIGDWVEFVAHRLDV